MQKNYEHKLIDLGYTRCKKCGYFTPQRIYLVSSQKMILGISVGKKQTAYYLNCPRCKEDTLITEEELEKYKNDSKKQSPFDSQKVIWKHIRQAHQDLAQYEKELKMKDFYDLVRNRALSNLQMQVDTDQFDYVFKAYLTNLAKEMQASKEQETE